MTTMQTFFIALADRTRRRILNLLREREICVLYFTEVLEVSQPKISRHLAYLRNAGLVAARREGKWMHYRIVEPEDFYAAQILQDTLDWLASQERMQKDFEKLKTLLAGKEIFPEPDLSPSEVYELPQAHMSFERKREELETFLL